MKQISTADRRNYGGFSVAPRPPSPFGAAAPTGVNVPPVMRTEETRTESMLARIHGRLASAGIRRPRFLRGPRMDAAVAAPVIRTSRLVLRPHRSTDAAEWFALQSDARVLEFLTWPRRTRAASLRHLKDRTKRRRLVQRNDIVALAIEKDGRLIGDVSLHLREVHPTSRSVEISWILDPAQSGAGLATEAATAVIDFAFRVVRARWVIAVTDIRNERSLALAGRLGFLEVRSDGSTVVLMVTPEGHTSARGQRVLRRQNAPADRDLR